MADGITCTHLGLVRSFSRRVDGCADCLESGDTWVHLRQCLVCGYVGCCSSSPNSHMASHFETTGHPLMRSLERGETWAWCYVDDLTLDPAPPPAS
ncbi:MAG TPA: UBP-type zinc finger domain-containing protein [Thermomicrobiales bacterium]|jgi:uncharacterized UBP type Zn finger protein|nr:UBP-type zinc finger domain-containing protein [Thermomicrobiales bacterium]